jgi:hypothetical protein
MPEGRWDGKLNPSLLAAGSEDRKEEIEVSA